MKIWLIQTGERLPLEAEARVMRTGLLGKELARRGHDVTWWTAAFDHYRRDWLDPSLDGRELMPGLSLRLLKGIGYQANLSFRRFIDHALVARAFKKRAAGEPLPDVIIAATPEYRIAHSAQKFAKDHGIPFIVDIRDRWPWDFLDHMSRPAQLVGSVLLAHDFAMVRTLMRDANSRITMMKSWTGWIGTESGRGWDENDRVFYLGAEKTRATPSAIRENVLAAIAEAEDRWPILFIGAFNNKYWPKQAIEAMALMGADTPDAVRPLLILAGDGEYRDELRRLSRGRDDVIMPGFVNDAEIAALLAIAKVGLITGNGDFDAMPNKVFTYLSGGLPILASIGGELVGLLESEGIGRFTPTSASMADALVEFIQNEDQRASMAARAQVVFDTQYEAGKLFAGYADHIEAAAAAHRSG